MQNIYTQHAQISVTVIDKSHQSSKRKTIMLKFQPRNIKYTTEIES